MLLFGGISLNYFDHETQTIMRDDFLPFINQNTSIVIDGKGSYTQYLLSEEFPEIFDNESGHRLHFGTNAEFMLADGIPTYQNGVIRLDVIDETRTLGYILGGIAADKRNDGNTAASGRIFEVRYTPVPRLPGDLDSNGIVDAQDINSLAAQILAPEPDLRFDLDQSGQLDHGDLEYLVEDILGSWFGDANLDGEFNSADLVSVFQTGEYEDSIPRNSSWETGDWTGDGEFDTSDLVTAFQAGGYARGPRALAVPEPGSCLQLLGILAIWRRRFSSSRVLPTQDVRRSR
jgi:hypothetical protein